MTSEVSPAVGDHSFRWSATEDRGWATVSVSCPSCGLAASERWPGLYLEEGLDPDIARSVAGRAAMEVPGPCAWAALVVAAAEVMAT